jgi:hypothetical protein
VNVYDIGLGDGDTLIPAQAQLTSSEVEFVKGILRMERIMREDGYSTRSPSYTS